MSTGQTVVDRARDTTLDEDASNYRTSDAKMLKHLNDFLRDAALLRPDLFATIGNIACTQGRMIQKAAAGSIHLLNVYGVATGSPITKVDWPYLELHYGKRWRSTPEGAAIHWIKHESDPNAFYIFPQAPSGQSVLAEYATNSADLSAISDSLPTLVSPMYDTAAHDYLVFRIETKDDESVLSARAELFMKKFALSLGVTMTQLEAALGRPIPPMTQKV